MLNIEDFKEKSWLPRNHNEQFKLALQLLNFSYSNHTSSLENEVSLLNGKIKELSVKLRDANDQRTEAKMLLQDLTTKNEKLQAENEQLVSSLRKLKVENKRLQSLANNIKSTIDANNCIDSLDTSLEDKKLNELSILESASTQTKSLTSCSRDKTPNNTSSRAQQVLAQIDISLNQSLLDGKSPTIMRRTSSAVRERTPSSVNGTIKRPLLPKSIAEIECAKEVLRDLNFNGIEESPNQVNQVEEGKAFFREARKLLPFDKFTNFMQQIKLLNKGQRTKEEVVKSAERLFGKENGRMVRTFKQLLSNRNTNKFLNMK